MNNHLLLVDDDRDLCQGLAVYFFEQGYQVTTATADSQARQLLASNRFDLAVLDWQLDGHTAQELVAHIHEHYPATKMIVFTGTDTPDATLENAIKGRAVLHRKQHSLNNLAMEVLMKTSPGSHLSLTV